MSERGIWVEAGRDRPDNREANEGGSKMLSLPKSRRRAAARRV